MKRTTAFLALAAAGFLAPLPAQEAKEPQMLKIFAWSEYVPDWLMEEFQQTTGVTVVLRTFASNEELLTRRLETGAFDLIQPSDYIVEGLIKRGQLEPLDRSKIPNLKNLDPSFVGLPHDEDGLYSVPWMGGTVGILVNTKKIPASLRACSELFSGQYAGRIASIDDPRQLVSLALASLSLPANEITQASLEKVAPVLENWMRQIVLFDSDTPGKAVVSGDADAALVWSGEAAGHLERDDTLRFVYPAERAFRFVDCFCIPKGSVNKEVAEGFLNFILRPEISARISADYPYTNPNAAAVKLLSPAQLSNPASYPPPGLKLESLRDVGTSAAALDLFYANLKEKIFKHD